MRADGLYFGIGRGKATHREDNASIELQFAVAIPTEVFNERSRADAARRLYSDLGR
jgi:hypothetical protein